MKKVLKILVFYALIPFLASLPGLILELCGLSALNMILVPALTVLAYFLFRKKLDLNLAAKTNGLIAVILIVCFSVIMAVSSGSVESGMMLRFVWLILPFAPVMLTSLIMGWPLLLYAIAILTYIAAFVASSLLGKIKIKKIWIPIVLVVVCLASDTALYFNRPAEKYAGHGFEYMHGYSSTDFTDYMVYSKNSKLATLDSPASLIIENEEDMPVMDGAEACYPLYAAFAKATYKDIDKIEEQWLMETDNPNCNGKIVTFTNTVQGFIRLLFGADGIDMFFGAKPSASQLQEAKESGVELNVTPIGKEAFVFFVEEDNPVDNLTTDQVKAIYHGDITNWKEVGGKNQKIRAFQRPKNSGSQTMMEYFMGDVSLKEPLSYEMVNAMDGVIRKVAEYNNEAGAMGYSFRYFLETLVQEEGVKMLSVDGVYPSMENIENGTYPLVTEVCLITRKNDPNPYVQKMIEFILSKEGQELVKKTGYAGIK